MFKTWESADKTVRKDIIKHGEFTRKPSEHSTCDIIIENIICTEASIEELRQKFNSKIFDGTPTKTLVIGDANSEIDRRIERAIQMMHLFEKSFINIHVPSEVVGQPICVQCELTLTGFKLFKPIWVWTPEEKYLIASSYKEDGSQLFKESRCIDAFHKFSKACKLLITMEPVQDLQVEEKIKTDIKNLRLVLYNNMAACQLNQKNFVHTISLCDKVLGVEKNNVKALYRRGVAHGNLRNLEKAVKDLKTALCLEPTNHAVTEKLSIFHAQLLESTRKFDEMVKKMFQT